MEIDNNFYIEAYKMGIAIANIGCNIVYGGSNLGLMGEVTQAAKSHGSEITGVMPEKLLIETSKSQKPSSSDPFIDNMDKLHILI